MFFLFVAVCFKNSKLYTNTARKIQIKFLKHYNYNKNDLDEFADKLTEKSKTNY